MALVALAVGGLAFLGVRHLRSGGARITSAAQGRVDHRGDDRTAGHDGQQFCRTWQATDMAGAATWQIGRLDRRDGLVTGPTPPRTRRCARAPVTSPVSGSLRMFGAGDRIGVRGRSVMVAVAVVFVALLIGGTALIVTLEASIEQTAEANARGPRRPRWSRCSARRA